MYPRDRGCGVHGLREGILEEVYICPTKDAYVVGIELDMDDSMVVRASGGDSGGESESSVVSIVAIMATVWGLPWR